MTNEELQNEIKMAQFDLSDNVTILSQPYLSKTPETAGDYILQFLDCFCEEWQDQLLKGEDSNAFKMF